MEGWEIPPEAGGDWPTPAHLVDPRAASGAALLRDDIDDVDDLVTMVGARDRHHTETARLMGRAVGQYREGVLDQDLSSLLEAWRADGNEVPDAGAGCSEGLQVKQTGETVCLILQSR